MHNATPVINPELFPQWLTWTEEWLVGGAMLAEPEDVVVAAAICTPDDFRDDSLGRIWAVLPYLDLPSADRVGKALIASGDLEYVGGYPRLIELSGSTNAFLHHSLVWLEANAEIVHEWGEKRRRLTALGQEAKAIFESGVKNVIPLYDRPEYAGLGDAV